MQPGRELDALIAERVMGLVICKCTDEEIEKWRDDYCSGNHESIGFYVKRPARFGSNRTCNKCGRAYIPALNYSTDISAAWEVVEKFKTWPWYMERAGDFFRFSFGYNGEVYKSEATTAPHAICLAALKAVEK